jgi:hypothetical protein
MWPAKTSNVLAKTSSALVSTGTRAVQFLRADYPHDAPRGGFVAAVALLPRQHR